MTTVRQQQLFLARERSVLQDQELELSHQLAESVRLLDTNYTLVQTIFNRRIAAERQVSSVQEAYKNGTVTFDLVLDAQRRQADAESAYFRALSDYNRSIAQVHYRKGSLLEYNNVLLAEGAWPGKAYFDAKRRARERDAGKYINYGFTRPDVISRGPVPQHQGANEVLQHVQETHTSHGTARVPGHSVMRKSPKLSQSQPGQLAPAAASNQNVQLTGATEEVSSAAPATDLGKHHLDLQLLLNMNLSRVQRLMQIVALLQTGKGYNAKTLAEQCGVTPARSFAISKSCAMLVFR